MCVEFLGAGRAESVEGKSRGIVDQKADRRKTFGGGEDGLGALGFGQIGDPPDSAAWHRIMVMMNMGDDRPTIIEQGMDDLLADPFATPRDDRCSMLLVHQASLRGVKRRSNPLMRRRWIASSPRSSQ
jgi:hypothetical protein